MADNIEIFEEFFDFVKNSENIQDVVKEWGGIQFTVPSFIGEYRNRAIYAEYLKLDPLLGEKIKYLRLSRDFRVSSSTIRKVIQAQKGEVGLFAVGGLFEGADDETV